MAVRNQFEGKKIVICLELHTYSSLDQEFIGQYAKSLDTADEILIFYDPEALRIKNRVAIPPETIEQAFEHSSLQVFTQALLLQNNLFERSFTNEVLVMMSSGNFGGMDWEKLIGRFL